MSGNRPSWSSSFLFIWNPKGHKVISDISFPSGEYSWHFQGYNGNSIWAVGTTTHHCPRTSLPVFDARSLRFWTTSEVSVVPNIAVRSQPLRLVPPSGLLCELPANVYPSPGLGLRSCKKERVKRPGLRPSKGAALRAATLASRADRLSLAGTLLERRAFGRPEVRARGPAQRPGRRSLPQQ